MKGLITLDNQAKIDAITCSVGYVLESSKTFMSINGKKHKTKHTKIININLVNRPSSFSRFILDLLLAVVLGLQI